jgi:hypothetical protein
MTSGDSPGPGDAWTPVIYGKTHRVDEWWRALPAGVTREGNAARVIKAAIADGRVPAPRFVLARLSGGTLVGVVSSASQFGTEMTSDSHGRPLFCFVGWHCDDPAAAVPSFGELTSDWERLVLPEYDTVMRPVWLAPPSEARVPVVPPPATAPWQVPGRRREEDSQASSPEEHPSRNTLRVFPSDVAATIWQMVADQGVRAALVTGWETYSSAISPDLTHVCADDFTGPVPLILRPPPRDSRRAPEAGSTSRARGEDERGLSGASPRAATTETGGPAPLPEDDSISGSAPGERGEAGRGNDRRGHDRDAGGLSGALRGGVEETLRRVRQGFSDILPGVDPTFPGDPPDGPGAWTFHPPATFEAMDGPYLFSYTIGWPAIRCKDQRTGGRLDWTGSHWEPATTTSSPSRQPASPPASGTTARPGRHAAAPTYSDEPNLLDQPPATGTGNAAPQAPPDMSRKLKTRFSGEFGRSARDRQAREAEAGEDGTGPDGTGPPQTGHTTPG